MANEEKYGKWGSILPIFTILVSLFILWGFAVGSSSIVWFLLIVNFIAGPACLFFYLVEVKKGVFKDEE